MITSITKEQQDKIPEFIKKWIDLASVPIDREVSLKTAKDVFGDKIILFTESIDNTVNLIKFILSKSKNKIGNFASQLDSQLHSQLHSQLDSQLYSQLYSQLKNTNWSRYVSYYLQDWCGYYDYEKYIGVKFDDKNLEKYKNIILNMPICIFVGEIVFICEKPEIGWDLEGRLHSETRQAIYWKYDNSGYYYLNGVSIEKELWERILSRQMSFQEILKIDNTEKRLVAMRYNPNALLKENPKLIKKSERGNELWLIENSEVNKIYNAPKVYLLGFIDPSKVAPNNKFYEEVDPELAEKNFDPDEINATHCKLTLEQYGKLVYET